MAEQRLDSSKRLRLSGSLLLCLATLGVCFALLAWQYSSVATGVIQKDYAIGSLPSTVEFQSLEEWGFQRAAVAGIGSIFLLGQFLGLGIVFVRHRRGFLFGEFAVRVALSIWIVTVVLTALLGPLKSNSVQRWELASQDIFALHLPRILAAQALPGLGEVLLSLTGTAFFAASSASFGLIFIRLLKRCSWVEVCDNSIALLATAFIIGQSAISCVLVLLSILGALNYLTLSALLLLCLAFGLYSLVQVGQGSLQQLRSSFLAFRSEARSWQIVGGLIVVLLALTVLQAWGRLSWDAGSNYFASAKLMASSHEFRYTSESYLAVSGFNAEATQAALIVLFGDRSARLVSWFMALSFIVFCAAIARELGVGRRGTIVAVAMVCTTTAFLDLIGDGKTDLYGAAMAIGAVYWLLQLRPPNRHLALALAGLLSGFALLYRPTYLFPLLVIVAVVIVQNRLATSEGAPLRTRLRPMIRDCLVIGGFAAIPVAFYLVRNILVVGAPLVPVYSPEATTGQLQATLQNWDYTGLDMTRHTSPLPVFCDLCEHMAFHWHDVAFPHRICAALAGLQVGGAHGAGQAEVVRRHSRDRAGALAPHVAFRPRDPLCVGGLGGNLRLRGLPRGGGPPEGRPAAKPHLGGHHCYCPAGTDGKERLWGGCHHRQASDRWPGTVRWACSV